MKNKEYIITYENENKNICTFSNVVSIKEALAYREWFIKQGMKNVNIWERIEK